MTGALNYIIFILVLFLSGCSTHPIAPVVERNVTLTDGRHTVQKGETVYSIAWIHGLDYRSLARWNGIARPYPIYPGQRLVLKPRKSANHSRKAGIQSKSASSTPNPAEKRVAGKSPGKSQQKNVGKKVSSQKVQYKSMRWEWPTDGKVFRTFSSKEIGKKGIAVSGSMRQSIKTSAPGRVVYSGEGLLRYGKLIIIKHNSTYLSAYAHNYRIMVKEGQLVRQGQKIAEMGMSGTDRIMLHFEIRKNGKPVDPLYFLPKR